MIPVYTHSHVVVVDDRDIEQVDVYGPFTRDQADMLAQQIITLLEAQDSDGTFVEVQVLHSPALAGRDALVELAHEIVRAGVDEEDEGWSTFLDYTT